MDAAIYVSSGWSSWGEEDDTTQPVVGFWVPAAKEDDDDDDDDDASGALASAWLLWETIASNKTVFLTTESRRYMVKESAWLTMMFCDVMLMFSSDWKKL